MILLVGFCSRDRTSLKKKPKQTKTEETKFGHACSQDGVFRNYLGGRSEVLICPHASYLGVESGKKWTVALMRRKARVRLREATR